MVRWKGDIFVRRLGELWSTVCVSEVGNGPNPNKTFGPRHRSERESTSNLVRGLQGRDQWAQMNSWRRSRAGGKHNSVASGVRGQYVPAMVRSHSLSFGSSRRECLETRRLLVRPDDSSSSFPPFKLQVDPEM